MEDDEDHQQHSTPAHQGGGKGGFDIALHLIFDRSCRPTHSTELERRGDVKRHTEEQDDSDDPKQLSIRKFGGADLAQEARISVDYVGTREDLEVSYHVADDEADERDAGHRHHHFLSYHGVPKGPRTIVDV